MTYGGRTPDMYRIAGAYTGRILKGEKPADCRCNKAPGSTDHNMKTAKALGIIFPITLLGRADEGDRVDAAWLLLGQERHFRDVREESGLTLTPTYCGIGCEPPLRAMAGLMDCSKRSAWG